MQNCAVSNRGLLEGWSDTSRPVGRSGHVRLAALVFQEYGIAQWFKDSALTHIYSCFDP